MRRVQGTGRVVLVCLAAAALWRPAGFVHAQSSAVPAPWTASDIGSPTPAGSTIYDSTSGTFTIVAGGADIWATSDQFRFVYQQVSGDVDIVARVDSLTQADVWSKSGIMIRASLAANAAYAYSLISAGNGAAFQRRTQTGVNAEHTAGSLSSAPQWVRLVRSGTQVTAYSSATGTTWTAIGSDTIALGSSAYVGIAVTSHNTTLATTSNVSHVSMGGSSASDTSVTVNQNGLSSPQDADIGNPVIAGSSTYSLGAYTITAAGLDIWGTSDQFHYVYQPVTGDLDISVRVASLTYVNEWWSKAGVMIRETLNADSRHASMFISAAQGYAFQRRPDTGGLSESTAGPSGAAPGWVRLKRNGSLFTAYASTDGQTWTVVGTDSISMTDGAYVGIAVTSHNANVATRAGVDHVSMTSSSTSSQSANQPPTVSFTAPANGTSYTAPANISMSASASDPEGQLTKVEFYAGSTLLGTDTAGPYNLTWSSVAAGTYSLTAVAYDAAGNKTTSNAVSVTVNPANQPPTVSLTAPANGSTFAAPASITLSATASDPEGQLTKVEFYSGSALLGTDTGSPYDFTWSSVGAGTYSLTAVAYDAAGNKTTSNAVSITVGTTNKPPTVSLATSGSTFTAPATITLTATASDPEGQLTKVEFYAGSTLLAIDTASPYTFTWLNVGAGTYSLTAIAYDAAGAKTTSAAVSVTVTLPPPRDVQFQASTDNATLVLSYRLDVFASNANVATATPVASVNLGKPTPDANGVITSDQSAFFTNLAVGNYLLTVSAIGTGGESRSAAVAFSR